MKDISTRVCEIVAAVLGEHHLFRPELNVTPDCRLDDLRVDDIDRIGIAMRVEETWNFVVTDKQEREWTEVQDIINTVGLREGVGA